MKECDLDELKRDVKDIRAVILGEDTHKGNGIMDRLSNAETKIKIHERYFYLAIGGGALFIFLSQLVTGCK